MGTLYPHALRVATNPSTTDSLGGFMLFKAFLFLCISSQAILFSGSPQVKKKSVTNQIIPVDDGGGETGGGGTTTPPTAPPYNISSAPGYPWPEYPATPGNVLAPGQALRVNEYLRSKSGRYTLIYQGDGNLVIYDYSKPIWDSCTSGRLSGGRLVMQTDGNLVIYDDAMYAHWDTGTSQYSGWGCYLMMQDDGNLVIYKEYGQDPALYYAIYGQSLAIWDSHGSHGNRF